ncbi:tyrosine-type recombinase/integrase [Saccharopolyspora gloriosae]|uniref:Site-specific recombinase XerD n=1 Tax=Saccharopolyspora gloriosae TaxID=455344 RepID=A0A840N9D5_9PSEU|nr:integrase [Saccharopolyspora gloriosae]MBB5067003.1 site-specific recombinase XerD [Saccharopolyspora gloriosae]
MSETTHDVRIWSIDKWTGKTKTTYWVRWRAATQRFKEPFSTFNLADAFRSKLVTATRNGIAFECTTGLPVTMQQQAAAQQTWFEFACEYVDMKWPDIAPNSRKSIADSLIPITLALLRAPLDGRDRQAASKALRSAFSTTTRSAAHPEEITGWLRWFGRNSRHVSELSEPDALRKLLSALDYNHDGGRAAANTVRLRRTTLKEALDFARERNLLRTNPMTEIKLKKATTSLRLVDRRSVANPVQARTLLNAVEDINDRLTAFFALLYFGALRPEEAAEISKRNLALPSSGWGEIYLEQAAPEVGSQWSDSRTRSEVRGLKHREDGVGRPVPCSPGLTNYLNRHLRLYGTAPDGRLFPGQRSGGRLGSSVYGRVWARARAAVFTEEVQASPLAKRPYDLRHAAVSTWLNAGVEPTRVAEWAGHSVHVLLRVYAKCLDGGETAARQRVQDLLGDR